MALYLMIILFIVAILPGIGLLLLVYFSDKIEREPVGLIFALLGMGVASIIPALIWEMIGSVLIEIVFPNASLFSAFIENFFLVAVAEESCKFICMFVITWKNRAFNYAFDGVVYAVATSLGFAIFENIMYVFSNVLNLGVLEGFFPGVSTGIARAFLAVPLHTSVAIFMGVFYGKAKEATFQHKPGKCFLFIMLSLIVPMFIHGFYDFLLSVANMMNTGGSILVFVMFGMFVVFMYVFTIVVNIYFSKHDHNITGSLKVKVTKDGWLRYGITDNREVVILGLTRPYQGKVLVIPEELDGYPVRTIARSAFAYTNIVNIQLPKNLRYIEDTAFFNCPYLVNVVLPDYLVSIGNYAFEYCYNIRQFLIPHIQRIGNQAFEGCTMLSDIYYLGDPEEWRRIQINIQENQHFLNSRFYYNTVRGS